MSEPNAQHTVIGRVFSVLDAFRTDMVLGVREIARRSELPPATVHRIVTQLVELGVLDRAGNQYRLGVRLFEIGQLHYPSKLRNAINPFLVDLQRATGADVAALELSGQFVVVDDHVPARQTPSPGLKVGARFPAHTSAAGKAIMAFSGRLPYDPDDPLIAVTPRTITTVAELQAELAQVCAAGVAFERGEADPTTNAVAAPLLNRHGRVLGALMVSSSAADFDPASVAIAVATAAHALTRVGANTNIPYYARLRPGRREEARSMPTPRPTSRAARR